MKKGERRKLMKKMSRRSEMKNIAGRDVGEEPLYCAVCGRAWGKDDLLVVGAEEAESGAVGICPGVMNTCGGLVYPKSKLPQKVKADE